MSLLIDANVIVTAILDKKMDRIVQHATLDLARYEVGNAFWKKVNVHRSMSLKEATKAVAAADQLIDMMYDRDAVVNMPGVLQIASTLNLSFYDASYLYAAKSQDMVLVTDDRRLKTAAESIGVRAQTSHDLL